jgi:syntaxin 16
VKKLGLNSKRSGILWILNHSPKKNRKMTAVIAGSRSSASSIHDSTVSDPFSRKQTCGRFRNLSTLYSKYRGDHKSKRSRFGYSILGEPSEGLGRKRLDLETGEEHLLGPRRLDSQSIGDVELRQITPIWLAVVDRIKDSIAKAREKLVALQKLQQKRLLRVFDDDGGRGDIEVEMTATSITNLLCNGERGVKELERYMTVDDKEMLVNIQKSLATQLTKVSTDFKGAQKKYMSEIRKRRAGGSFEESISTSATDVLDAGFTEDQLLELEEIESQVETRSQEITKIAKSINELNSVFKEMATLVVEQGTILDRIDYNMENVVKDTAQATKELTKAEETQKNSRVQKCIIALVAFIIFNLLLLTARA